MKDATTRYSVDAVVPDTEMEAAIIVLDSNWIFSFWPPISIQFDQAISNQEFENFLDFHDISARHIPALRHSKNVLESKYKVIRHLFLRIGPNICNETTTTQQAIRISKDLYGNDVCSSLELVNGFTHPRKLSIEDKIEIFWPLVDIFYSRTVFKFDTNTEMHGIKFDDGDYESLIMKNETSRPLQSNQVKTANISSIHDEALEFFLILFAHTEFMLHEAQGLPNILFGTHAEMKSPNSFVEFAKYPWTKFLEMQMSSRVM